MMPEDYNSTIRRTHGAMDVVAHKALGVLLSLHKYNAIPPSVADIVTEIIEEHEALERRLVAAKALREAARV